MRDSSSFTNAVVGLVTNNLNSFFIGTDSKDFIILEDLFINLADWQEGISLVLNEYLIEGSDPARLWVNNP